MKRILILTIMMLPVITNAQYVIKGRILKPDSIASQSFPVKLYLAGDDVTGKTTLTDTSGYFTFFLSEGGRYHLVLQSIFYKDTIIKTISVSQNNIIFNTGTLILKPASETLSTVRVISNKKLIEYKNDHIIFTPSADPVIGARPVSEILNQIPGVDVDANNRLTAKGQEGVQLLVNDCIIRSSATDYLSQLSADEIERIEVYDNATKYSYIKSPVIINVILKNRKQKKLWNAGLNTNSLPKLNPSFDLHLSYNKYRITARLSHDISVIRSEGYYQRLVDTIDFLQQFNNRMQHTMTNGKVGWEYFPDSSTILSTELSFLRHNDKLRSNGQVQNGIDVFKSNIQSSPVEKELSGWVNYKKDHGKKGYKLIEAGITRFSLVSRRNLPGLILDETRNMTNYAYGLKAEWQKVINHVQLLNGINVQVTKVDDVIDTSDANKRLNNIFNHNGITSYHEIAVNRNPWNLSFGTNIDFVSLHDNRSGNNHFEFRNFFINPSLKVNRLIGSSRISFSFNRRYILPSTHMMFGQYNQYEVGRASVGNYQLNPSIQNLLKLSFMYNRKYSLLWEIYYDIMKNPFTIIYHVDQLSVLNKPENVKNRKSVGSVFSFSFSPASIYSFTLNINGRVNQYNISKDLFIANPVNWFFSSSLINRFKINEKFSVSGNIHLNNWRTTLYRKMDPFVVFTVQGNYKFNKKMNLSFGINDIFDNMQFSYTGFLSPGFIETGFTKSRFRNISLSLRYQLINQAADKKGEVLKSFVSE